MDSAKLRFIRPLNELQRSIERYEILNDGQVLPDLRLVIRLDAHRHGDWSRIPESEYPCGPKISQALIGTAHDVMQSGLHCVLSMIHGDEIAVYIDPREVANARRRARLISFFASSAAAHFLLRFGLPVLFHARLAELPSTDRLIEYFMWQRRCCFRNAVAYSLRRALIAKGTPPDKIESQLERVSEEDRIRQLAELGSPVSNLSPHTRYGSLVSWQKIVNGPGAVSTGLTSQVGLPEGDEEFIDVLLERLKVTAPSESGRLLREEPPPSEEVAQTPPPQRESVRFSHEKGSKRNTLIMRVPSDYKR